MESHPYQPRKDSPLTKIKEKPYTIDVNTLPESGAFSCPKCGVVISPEDETEVIYSVVGTKTKNNNLSELILKCNKCKSRIILTGFYSEKKEEK